MKVSERLQHGFWAWSVIAATAILGIPVQTMGQTDQSSADASNASVHTQLGDTEFNALASATSQAEQARMTLLKARQALAHGDLATAETMVFAARRISVDFDQLGDSPDAVQSMIAYQIELAKLAKAKDRSFNTKAAEFLLQQAVTMIQLGDLQTAHQLVDQAQRFPVDFNLTKLSPQKVIAQLTAARQAAQEASGQIQQVRKLMSRAQLAFDQGNYAQASQWVAQAKALNVPDSAFAADQIRPWQLELRIQNAMQRGTGQVVPASFNANSAPVVQADYDPSVDRTQNIPASATGFDVAASTNEAEQPAPSRGVQLYRSAMQALENQDRDGARDYLQLAWQYQEQLDPQTRQSIQDNLSQLDASATADEPASEAMLDLTADADGHQALFRKLQSEVFKERAAAERTLPTSPRKALERMTMIRNRVSQSELDADTKRPLLTIIDRDITEMQNYIEQNLPQIMNEEANASRMEAVETDRQRRYDIESQIQTLVEDFNDLLDEGRYAEADAIARQAAELAPDSEIVALLREKSRVAVRVAEMERIKAARENGMYSSLRNAEASAEPFDDSLPLQWGDPERYSERVRIRQDALDMRQYNSAAEREIWNKLKNTNVQGQYRGTLFDVVDQLATQSGVNIIFDNIALAAEGIETNRPVDIPIHKPISLRSALNIVLGSAGLVFVVEDEVIKVTSRDAQRKDVKPKHYYVGDLIMPIQNMNQALHMNFMRPGMGPNMNSLITQYGNANQVPLTMQGNPGGGAISPIAAAQQAQMAQQMMAMGQQLPNGPFGGGLGLGGNYGGGPIQTGQPQYNSVGPSKLGGITEADFEPLIDLIRSTIDPEGWDDTNGDGTIQAFVPNLSLIVSQTQEVQDQIQDLLNKLRELNDVQIVVEVRFVTVRDQFFERIGIDFDFQINDNSGLNGGIPDVVPQSAVVGRSPRSDVFAPTADLDVVFNQDNFASALPQFGGFDVGTAANFGFAILSDIEVYFLIQASKGDTRSNITQAPTITMFNGQSATVQDGANRPFVTSVIPVVGDFAVAQQPVITILPEGTSLNVQAVVSSDRKSIRMTLVPFFSEVRDVTTFTFDGKRTTARRSDNLLDDLLGNNGNGNGDGNGNGNQDNNTVETSTEGVTIQLPVLAFTTVNTVVNVPDGGTVLMGGIKRMREGRTERGVPFLSNIPYINRLFRNVGIGRETENLMMMVTPRIIIVEEEEQIQVGPLGGN